MNSIPQTSAINARRGFTLVELLVVIGIIALLISILLPTLSRARESAKSLVCLSNLRQIGTGLNLYANDFKQTLPYGYWNGGTVPGGGYDGVRADEWSNLLLSHLDDTAAGAGYVDNANYAGALTRDMMRCPSAIMGNALTQYGAHPRLMPNLQDADGSTTGRYLQPRKIGTIAESANTLLIADASLVQDVGGGATWGAAATLWRLDWIEPTFYGLFNEPWMLEDTAEHLTGFFDRNVAGGTNEDGVGQNNWGTLRFRHGGGDNKDFRNVSCNILYADGHAQGHKAQGELEEDPNQIDTGLDRRFILVER